MSEIFIEFTKNFTKTERKRFRFFIFEQSRDPDKLIKEELDYYYQMFSDPSDKEY